MIEPTQPGVYWEAATSALLEPPKSLNFAVLMKQSTLHILLSRAVEISSECMLPTRFGGMNQVVTVTRLPSQEAQDHLAPGEFILLPAMLELHGEDTALRFDQVPGIFVTRTHDEDNDDQVRTYLTANSLAYLGWYLCQVKFVNWSTALVTVRICSTIDPIVNGPDTVPFLEQRVYDPKGLLISFFYDGDYVFSPGPALRVILPPKGAFASGTNSASALATMAPADIKLQFRSQDGTFTFIKTDPTKHLEHLATSLPLMRLLGRSPRWLAFFGSYSSYILRPEIIRERLSTTLLLGTASGCFEGRDLYDLVSKFPAVSDPAKFLALLKLKFSMLSIGTATQLSISDFIDPAHLTYDVHSTAGLTHILVGLDGIQVTLECHAGPVYFDCLRGVIGAINDKGIIAREYEPKVVALAIEQGLLDFSVVMSADGSNPLDDPRAKQFCAHPDGTALTTISILQKILLDAIQPSSLQRLTQSYPMIMKRHREAHKASDPGSRRTTAALEPPTKKLSRQEDKLSKEVDGKKLCTLDLMGYLGLRDFQGELPKCAQANCAKIHASTVFPGMSPIMRIRTIENKTSGPIRKAALRVYSDMLPIVAEPSPASRPR